MKNDKGAPSKKKRTALRKCGVLPFVYQYLEFYLASAFARSTNRWVASFNAGTVEGMTNWTSVGLFLHASRASSFVRYCVLPCTFQSSSG